jgi:hypothetical protein
MRIAAVAVIKSALEIIIIIVLLFVHLRGGVAHIVKKKSRVIIYFSSVYLPFISSAINKKFNCLINLVTNTD